MNEKRTQRFTDNDPIPAKPIMVVISEKERKEDPDKALDKALRKFKKKVYNSGILDDYRKNQFFEKPTDKRRRVRKENNLRDL